MTWDTKPRKMWWKEKGKKLKKVYKKGQGKHQKSIRLKLKNTNKMTRIINMRHWQVY